mmetsp:Transcript_20318/g.37998  ORF Transcript_20318/g.37998 Transcript_20318/m.37998 type:complete len:80 (-) Transcript_20318:1121-1360(-)
MSVAKTIAGPKMKGRYLKTCLNASVFPLPRLKLEVLVRRKRAVKVTLRNLSTHPEIIARAYRDCFLLAREDETRHVFFT